MFRQKTAIATALCFLSFSFETGFAQQASPQSYDETLCSFAQRYIVNAETNPSLFKLNVQSAQGIGFHTIQMDADGETQTVSIATTKTSATLNGAETPTYVSCKMVNRDRVNDVLDLNLEGEARSCKNINEETYRHALESLTPNERLRFETDGKPLKFVDDYVSVGGSEWLPASVSPYIQHIWPKDHPTGFLEVQAPSVQVPWNSETREFFEGTHHCKLITKAAMRNWMTGGGLRGDTELFPADKPQCFAPSSPTSKAGSCQFYFAPADAMFCNDYSGSDWTVEKAKAACGKRHASRAALTAASSKYEGKGGLYSVSTCAARDDVTEILGTCVFQCNTPGENQWRTLAPASAAGGNDMMSKACDLYIEGSPVSTE